MTPAQRNKNVLNILSNIRKRKQMLFFEVLKIPRSQIPHKHTTSKKMEIFISTLPPHIYMYL